MTHPVLPELLCPAGDLNALKAAVDSGADAVYLGYKAFGARASAVNFDAETLAQAVSYAHLYHARVHVTVNTLIKENEMSAVQDAIQTIRMCGADAVIVQDLGVASFVRENYPDLALHASTQMGLSNAEDALFARNFGFSRVVLARECTLDEIRKVVATGIETEVFAHGALCSGVSGRCLMSSMAGGRSGNRGRCAQPCRLRFRMGDRSGALLSLRDLCTLPYLPDFVEAGVRSLKIEGRLKSPEYVAVVASIYRKALDQIANGTFDPDDPAPMDALMQIFNRGGFTRGHAFGAEDADMCTTDRVSHEGVPIGKITRVKGSLAQVMLTRDLHDGDSLQLRGQKDGDMRYAGHNMPAGSEATLRLRPGLSATAGETVARLSDALQLQAARAHAPTPIPVVMSACFQKGATMQLTLSDGISRVEVFGDTVQEAQKRSATPDDVRRQLDKLGETPFVLSDTADLSVYVGEGVFLPVSSLNELRRKGTEALREARFLAFDQKGRRETLLSRAPATDSTGAQKEISLNKADDIPVLAAVFSDPGEATALKEAGADVLIFEPLSLTESSLMDAITSLPEGCLIQLPPQISQSALQTAASCIRIHQSKLAGVVAGCVGQIGLFGQLPVWAGPGIPITNRMAVQSVSSLPVEGFHLWPEWSGEELRMLRPFPKPAWLKIYGREILMLLNHCPERTARQLSQNRNHCSLCSGNDMACGMQEPYLTDQKGYRFPLQRQVFPEGCMVRVLAALPTDLRHYGQEIMRSGAGWLLHFTTETLQEKIAVITAFDAVRNGQPAEKAPGTAAGYWKRGVE